MGTNSVPKIATTSRTVTMPQTAGLLPDRARWAIAASQSVTRALSERDTRSGQAWPTLPPPRRGLRSRIFDHGALRRACSQGFPVHSRQMPQTRAVADPTLATVVGAGWPHQG